MCFASVNSCDHTTLFAISLLGHTLRVEALSSEGGGYSRGQNWGCWVSNHWFVQMVKQIDNQGSGLSLTLVYGKKQELMKCRRGNAGHLYHWVVGTRKR